MKMSDKDFDQLFNSKLTDLEIEPSAKVWSNINNDLSNKAAGKKKAIPYMRIAAAIIAIMGVSLFFIRPDTEKIKLHGPDTNSVIEHTSVKSSNPSGLSSSNNIIITPEDNIEIKHIVQSYKHLTKHNKDVNAPVISKPVDSVQYVAVSDPNQAIDIHSKTSMQNSITTTIMYAPVSSNNDKAIQPVGLKSQAQNIVAKPKGKKIRSLGDLLNVVIAKVDKREDKIIEFTDSGDDDTFNISGVNLGLIKVKKEN